MRSRVGALIHLLGDDNRKIVATAWEYLEQAGEEVLPLLEEAATASSDPRVRRQCRRYLLEWSRREVFQGWVDFCRGAIDLERGVVLIAQSEYPNLDTGELCDFFATCARIVARRVRTCRSTEAAVGKLVEHLHGELGFMGNEADYYDPDNSYLNRVIERRVGIPISLSTVYLLVSRRLALSLYGVGLPHHFLLKFQSPTGEHFLDAFHGGKRLSSRDCAVFLEQNRIPFDEFYLRAVSDREILSRTLGNLLRVYHSQEDERRLNRVTAMLRLLEQGGTRGSPSN